MTMLLSVIVSAFSLKRIGDLKDLLDGLSRQTYKNLEIIAVIDESTDLVKEVQTYIHNKKYENVSLVFNPINKGLSYSRNIGIEHSSGAIIAFIDDDAVPFPNWAQFIVETFREDDCIGALTGEVIPMWEHESMSWFPKELHWMISCSYVMTPKIKQEFERGFGTNMAFKRIIFNKTGMFDTNFGINGKKWVGGEDTDMFLRVKKLGMKVIFNPEICVHHKIYKYRIQYKNLIKRAFNGGYSVALMKSELKYEIRNSTESSYLKHLLFKFYPKKIKCIIVDTTKSDLKSITAVSIVMIAEICGYTYGIMNAVFTRNCIMRLFRQKANHRG